MDDPSVAATADLHLSDISLLHPLVLLREAGAHPNRRLSQCFLAEPVIAEAMVQAADIGSSDTVLEIGPGLGMLTQFLIRTAGSVVAVELDAQLADSLPSRLENPSRLRVIQGDALHLDLEQVISQPFVVVASLPYHVATPILTKLVLGPFRPLRAVVMVQEEVAERIVARPGALTYLGAAFATRSTARIVRRVPPGAFYPRPKVRSAILRIEVHDQPTVDVDSLEAFLAFLRSGFAQPRKQLHNSLSQGLQITTAETHAIAQRAGVDSSRRPGELALPDWAALYRAQPEGGA